MGIDDVFFEVAGYTEVVFLGDVVDGINDDALKIVFEKLAEFGFAERLVGAGAEGFVLVEIVHDKINGLFEVATGVGLIDDMSGVVFEGVFE